MISLIVHTRNSAGTLPQLLATTKWIADRIIIDMESVDGTQALAGAAGCRVVSVKPSDGVDAIRNDYLPLVQEPWTLVLDSDEWLSADAEAEVTRLIADQGATHDAFAIPRFNRIAGQTIRNRSWYPDQQTRLFRTGTVAWQSGHHRPPRVLTGDDRLKVLEPPDCLHIHHHNYGSLAEFIERQVRYAITDRYDQTFDFNAYLAASYAELEHRHDPRKDGDLSAALAIVMSWDKIMRGVIHWERSGRSTVLDNPFTLPFVVEATDEAIRLRKELKRLKASKSWRLTAPLRAIYGALNVRGWIGRKAGS